MVYQVAIEIIEASGHTPSIGAHSEHGPANGTAQFKIKSGLRPTTLQMTLLLTFYCDEWCLTHYDHVSGQGQFIALDFDPPKKGSTIQLECLTEWPQTRTLVFERSD